MCITSGSTVALFNRVRSQTISTRYWCLNNENNFIITSTSDWEEFIIIAANDIDRTIYRQMKKELNFSPTYLNNNCNNNDNKNSDTNNNNESLNYILESTSLEFYYLYFLILTK